MAFTFNNPQKNTSRQTKTDGKPFSLPSKPANPNDHYKWALQIRKTKTDHTTQKLIDGGGPKPKTTSPIKTEPNPNIAKYGSHTHIDWAQTPDVTETLAKLEANRFTIHTQPTGYGKTAVAVKTLAYSPYTWAIIVTPKAIKEQAGWPKTINSWNNTHPDNQVEVFMLETPERMTRILQDTKAMATITRRMAVDGPGLLIIDEVHGYKNPASQRSKSLRKWPGKILGLTATPFTNDRIMDSITYLVHNRVFNSKTAAIRELGLQPWINQWGQLDIYSRDGRVEERAFRDYPQFIRQVADLLDSPPVLAAPPIMPDTDIKLIQYDSSDEVARINSIVRAANAGMYEHNIEVAHDIQTAICTDPVRTERLLKIIGADGCVQPLIFFQNTLVADHLEQVLTDYGYRVVRVDGDNRLAAGVADDEGVVFLLQYQSASEGIEFLASNTTVFFQNQYSYMRLVQAAGRNVRRSSAASLVSHWQFVGSSLFERSVFERVESMGELNDELLSGLVGLMLDGKR